MLRFLSLIFVLTVTSFAVFFLWLSDVSKPFAIFLIIAVAVPSLHHVKAALVKNASAAFLPNQVYISILFLFWFISSSTVLGKTDGTFGVNVVTQIIDVVVVFCLTFGMLKSLGDLLSNKQPKPAVVFSGFYKAISLPLTIFYVYVAGHQMVEHQNTITPQEIIANNPSPTSWTPLMASKVLQADIRDQLTPSESKFMSRIYTRIISTAYTSDTPYMSDIHPYAFGSLTPSMFYTLSILKIRMARGIVINEKLE